MVSFKEHFDAVSESWFMTACIVIYLSNVLHTLLPSIPIYGSNNTLVKQKRFVFLTRNLPKTYLMSVQITLTF